jgi:hypothetical protein
MDYPSDQDRAASKDGCDAANVMLGHGVSYPVSKFMTAEGQWCHSIDW